MILICAGGNQDNAEQLLTRVRMFLSEEKTAPIEPYSKL